MIDRDVATRAMALVKVQKQEDPKHDGESSYRAACERLPILLRTAGLRRTVAFLDAKGGVEKIVLSHLREQLQSAGIYSDEPNKKLDLLKLIVSKETSLANYRHLSSLAFRVAYWHKRMSQALLRTKPKEQTPEETR